MQSKHPHLRWPALVNHDRKSNSKRIDSTRYKMKIATSTYLCIHISISNLLDAIFCMHAIYTLHSDTEKRASLSQSMQHKKKKNSYKRSMHFDD
jgi:hypothetical protein